MSDDVNADIKKAIHDAKRKSKKKKKKIKIPPPRQYGKGANW